MVDKDLVAKCALVGEELIKKEKELIEATTAIGFTNNSILLRLKEAANRLKKVRPSLRFLERRKGICREGEEVALMLSYNRSFSEFHEIAAQLAMGNRVRVKPSEITHHLSRIIGRIWESVAPESVTYDFTPGAEFMRWAIKEPKIRAICLWGSHLVALPYMDSIKAAKKMFIFEGPGKNPFVVFDDADIKLAAKALFLARFRQAGQVCMSPGIMYVHSKVFDEFVDTFAKLTNKLVVGDPQNPRTNIGPLGSRLAVTRIKEQLEDAKTKGAKIIYGGRIEGNLVYPTIIVNTNQSMMGMQDESFGPICWFETFDSTEEVIKTIKKLRFGLQMMVYGQRDGSRMVAEFKGEDYCHEVDDFVFGKYGSVLVNFDVVKESRVARRSHRSGSRGFGGRGFGGYGYSGWVCNTIMDKFILKQGPKNISIETSIPY